MIQLKDIQDLTESEMVTEKYLTAEEPELFIEFGGYICEPVGMYYKDGHLVIRNFVKLGKIEDIDLSS